MAENLWMGFQGKKSDVWGHFLQNRKDKNIVKCKHCDNTFRYQPSPSTFKYHLEHKHDIKVETVESTKVSGASQSSILSHFQKNTEETSQAVIARLTAVDRIPFATLARSIDIKNGWKAQGLKIPGTKEGIREMVMNFGAKIRAEDIKSLKSEMDMDERFSLTLDEWTSKRNRRYMCLNLHYSHIKGLGMIRVEGSMPAEKGLALVNKKLESFGLKLKTDVVGMTTDGAAVMKKLGELSGIVHQLCHSHGIHLAVTDVLYKKQPAILYDDDEEESGDNNNEDEDDDDDNENGESVEEHDQGDREVEFEADINSLVKKIRKVAKFFRQSPVRNDLLQNIVKREKGKQLSLILDSKTRWNSMLAMVQRFLELSDVLPTALNELASNHLFPSEDELQLATEIVDSLNLVEVAVLALGRRDSDLAKADKIFTFLLSNLEQQTGALSTKLGEAITTRILERRNPLISGLLVYLDDAAEFEQLSQDSPFEFPTKTELAKTARDLFVRLFPSQDDNNEEDDENAEEEPPAKQSKAEELDALLSRKTVSRSNPGPRNFSQEMLKTMKKEMAVFESTGKRPSSLEKVYKALKTIPPSSVEAERSFSAAGLFVTKLRTTLNDETVDTLCFLRSHLLNKS